jgi:hypothetical protein
MIRLKDLKVSWGAVLVWVGLALLAIADLTLPPNYLVIPKWAYVLAAIVAFNYVYSNIIERLDLIQSQLDDIMSNVAPQDRSDLPR